jgi:hypothetical protein
MIAFSPGLALACFELLEMAVRRELRLASIAAEFSKIGVMPAGKVIDLAQTLNWIRSGDDDRATVTVEGHRILSLPSYEERVRKALLHYIDVVRPPWIQNATFGRAKVIAFAGNDIAQVFVEAGLAHGTEVEVVEFWDELAARARGQKGARLNAIGRAGERLTIERETRRTGRKPKWVSIDSNADGYDVLSVAGPSDGRHLSIEVKATKIGLAGSFHLTANEWERALVSDLHVFHLWDMSSSCPALAEITRTDVAPHVPADRGRGQWEAVEIPFEAFAPMFAPPQTGMQASLR